MRRRCVVTISMTDFQRWLRCTWNKYYKVKLRLITSWKIWEGKMQLTKWKYGLIKFDETRDREGKDSKEELRFLALSISGSTFIIIIFKKKHVLWIHESVKIYKWSNFWQLHITICYLFFIEVICFKLVLLKALMGVSSQRP